MKVYSGADNGITISRVYSIKFYCDYQMAWYPFDQQVCMVDMVMDGVLDNYADLLPGALHFSGPKELTQYYVKTFKIKKSEVQHKVAVLFSITLGRRLLGTFLTIFFPTIILNLISHATNFCEEFFFR